jgi:hypothetical protein
MLELFSRELEALPVKEGTRLTPIPTDSNLASLSAILMDDTYYAWLMAGRTTVDGVRIVGAEYLIPLKARAFLDLAEPRANGGDVDERNLKKHKNDVVRLLYLLVRQELRQGFPQGGPTPEGVRESGSRLQVGGFHRLDTQLGSLARLDVNRDLESERVAHAFVTAHLRVCHLLEIGPIRSCRKCCSAAPIGATRRDYATRLRAPHSAPGAPGAGGSWP